MKDSIKAKAGQPETHNNYLSHIRAVYNKALKDNMTYREFKFETDYFEKTNKHSKKNSIVLIFIKMTSYSKELP